jgi:RNA-directed DNA polymerase
MHVLEESDSGIVPVNHSNKDRTSLAESEEGRLLIKENTFSSDTFPTLSGVERVTQVTSVRASDMLGRYLSAIRDRMR